MWLSWLFLVAGVWGVGSAARVQHHDGVTDGAPPVSWPEDYAGQLRDSASFDYIVVGAGAAGAAAASRLALAGADVLLVEAGGDPNIFTRIPGLAMTLTNTEMDWAYPTVPNNYSCLSSLDGNCRFARGFCLGGSTSINFMLYFRGSQRDFEDWNIKGWTYEDVLPYFLRSQGLQDSDQLPQESKPFHNTSGIMKVGFFGDSRNAWNDRLLTGFQELNIPFNKDVNGKSSVGVTKSIGYVYDGERMSTARAYLGNEEIKSKLRVVKNAHCTEVIIDENNVAKGVKIDFRGLLPRAVRVYARKEVILSAGAVGTPQILMLSGVGPAEHLEEMGIEVKSDLPIGENMSDHVLALIFMTVNSGLSTPTFMTYGMKALQAARWLATKSGPLKTIGTADVLTMYNSKCFDYTVGKYMGNRTDCELSTTQLINVYTDKGMIPPVRAIAQESIGFNDEVFNQVSDMNLKSAFLTFSSIILRPYSRGSIRLASKNGLDKPIIHANYLEDPRDVEEILSSILILEELVKTEPFRSQNASLVHIKLKDCPEYDEDREAYWSCYVRHLTYSVYHAVGTASLGTCVDERLNVQGVRNLRVADLSVVPLLNRGNTEALAVAIGERVADFILEDQWRANSKLQQ